LLNAAQLKQLTDHDPRIASLVYMPSGQSYRQGAPFA
jgi:hypothetical protein